MVINIVEWEKKKRPRVKKEFAINLFLHLRIAMKHMVELLI